MVGRKQSRWLIGLVLVALAVPAIPLAAQVNEAGQIVFAYSPFCCDYDIFVMDADGANLVNLTNTPNDSEFDPSWSPDGSKIAYSRDGDIWVMNSDGTNQTNLSNSTQNDFGADWSPDGSQVVFTRELPGVVISNQFDILTMNGDGTNQTNITNSDFDELEPAWSPAGSRIAFAAVRVQNPEEGGDWEIVTANTDGSGESILTVTSQEDRGPDWSPDGSKIVWMSAFDNPCCGDWEIWAMNADGTGRTNLTNDPAGDIYPSWSLDGTQITFLSNRATGFSMDVFVMDAPTVLSTGFSSSFALASEPTRLTTSGAAADPSWGPDDGGGTTFHSLTVSKSDAGAGTVTSNPSGIKCGNDCSQDYANSAVVTLTAKPARGSTFAGWSGACTGTGSCVVTMSSAKTVTATFNLAGGGGTFSLSVTKSGSGAVTSAPAGIKCGADCSESYASGTTVTLTARANRGSTFSGWSGACTGTSSCVVTMNAAKSVVATFSSG